MSGLITRNLDAAKRSVSIGYQYSNHAVKNSGGGIESGTLFLGYDRIFNPEFIGSIQLGYTDANRAKVWKCRSYRLLVIVLIHFLKLVLIIRFQNVQD